MMMLVNLQTSTSIQLENGGKRPVSKLNGQHKDHFIRFYDEKPTATIDDGINELIKSFKGLSIKKSRVAEFMKEECNLSLKSITRHPAQRNSPETIEARAVWVAEWLAKGTDYNNCVFLDESGFNINMTRGKAWSKVGEPAIEVIPFTRAVSKTALGAISSIGVVNVSVREAGNVKRRKVVGATKRKVPGNCLTLPKGTTDSHFMQFVVNTMGNMDQFPEMKGYHIVMDNAPIHVHDIIDPIITRRGYILVYPPHFTHPS
jgi:hypothetical protein